jgi:hypothetical protein
LPDFSSLWRKYSCTSPSAFWGRAQVLKTVPPTGLRATRLPSSEVSFSKDTTAIFFGTAVSFPVSAVRTGALEAHPASMGMTMQRAATSGKGIFKKGFTLYPRRDDPRMLKGQITKKSNQKKVFGRTPILFLIKGFPFVERTPLMRAFRVTASRKARAKALKIASAMW